MQWSQSRAVLFQDADFAWQAGDGCTVLKGIDVQIADGEFVAVIGPVGSGKSSILNAIIGELYKQKGHVSLNGSVGFVAQTPFIMNETLRENILYGRPMDAQLYKQYVTPLVCVHS